MNPSSGAKVRGSRVGALVGSAWSKPGLAWAKSITPAEPRRSARAKVSRSHSLVAASRAAHSTGSGAMSPERLLSEPTTCRVA